MTAVFLGSPPAPTPQNAPHRPHASTRPLLDIEGLLQGVLLAALLLLLTNGLHAVTATPKVPHGGGRPWVPCHRNLDRPCLSPVSVPSTLGSRQVT